jgi:hypothetical protein
VSKYGMLVRVLDGIRAEAGAAKFNSLYANGSDKDEQIWQARARAYIHLYLEVMFGLTEFKEREEYITDGSGDGGIDGYYIDRDARKILLIQSKFRTTKENFERKPIRVEEILLMQVRRIMGGERLDEHGISYNGKILGLQRRVYEIPDIGRYTTHVVMIAEPSWSISLSSRTADRWLSPGNY